MPDHPSPRLPRDSPSPHFPVSTALPGGLPRPLTTFIGREREVAVVREMLGREDIRLVTLTGPGGMGKTRLAIEVARDVTGFPDGVWFVALASIQNPMLVAPTIASTVGVIPNASRRVEQNLAAHLQNACALLVLDNFEQVLDAASLITGLLSACPSVKVLVTSRSVLKVSGEHVYTVPPLLVHDTGNQATEHASEAIRLFVERARARRADFSLTERNAAAVAELCRHLDGLPLAIELAAARVNLLSPADLLHRLGVRLALLTDGFHDQPGRLRSLRESIAWSYDLLTSEEQVLFRRLGAFAGPWTLKAAEAVVYGSDEPHRLTVFHGIASLIDKNLVRHQIAPSGESQYQLLETIREFATELLNTSAEAGEVRQRLTAYLQALADGIVLAWFQPDGAERCAHLDVHAADLWQGLARAERQGDVEALICLATSLAIFQMRGQYQNSPSWIERAVELGRAHESPMLGRALASLAHFIHGEGEEQRAWERSLEAVALLEAQVDREYLLIGYTECAIIAQRNGAIEEAEAYHKRALELISMLSDVPWAPFAESSILANLGNNAIQRGDIAGARVSFERAVALQVTLGSEPGTSHLGANHAIAGLGDVARGERDHTAAIHYFQHTLRLARDIRDYRSMIYALGGLAATLACTGQWRVAARLFGATEQLHQRIGIDFGLETMDRQRGLGLPEPWFRADEPFGSGRHIREALWGDEPSPYPPIPDPVTAAELWKAGREVSLDDAVAEALAASLSPVVSRETAAGLSPRELEVLRHLVDGKSDAEIASALFVSRRTVAAHVQHIYNKLGVSSRAEAAVFAVRQGLA